MDVVLEIGTKNYLDDLLTIKKALSHMESLVDGYNGYMLSEPSSKFGWTFFKISLMLIQMHFYHVFKLDSSVAPS